MIDFEFIDLEIPSFDSEFFVFTINDLIKSENFVEGEITIVFCNDDYLLDINRPYLNHDYYTDIITFDYSEGVIISGDLFVSIDRIIENTSEFVINFYFCGFISKFICVK